MGPTSLGQHEPFLTSGEAVTLSMGLLLSASLVADTKRPGLKALGWLGIILMGGQLILKRIV